MVVAVLLASFLAAPFPGEEEVHAGGGNITFFGHGRGHGVGMCMAGVYYRAMRGEQYHDIIRAYYTGVSFSQVSDDMPIRVLCRDNVVRTYPLKEYLYRLQEEPDSWPTQGLRVTMVGARTYALSCIARGKHAGRRIRHLLLRQLLPGLRRDHRSQRRGRISWPRRTPPPGR